MAGSSLNSYGVFFKSQLMSGSMLREESLANLAVRTRAGSDGRGFFALVSLALCALLIQGCMALQVRHPLPENLLEQVEVDDLPDIRAWGDVYSKSLQESGIESVKQELAANHGKLEPEAAYLLLSGGGGDGAFGAGNFVRLDGGGDPASIQAGHRHQHRGSHCALRLPGAGL